MSNGKVYIGLGANLGNPRETFDAALQELENVGCTVLKKSSLYWTHPYGFADQADFINAVIEVETDLPPLGLLTKVQEIERVLGKKIVCNNGPRVIDLDLLLYKDVVLGEQDLVLPHPGIPKRDFVLLPLKEIAPKIRHPVENQTISNLLEVLKDRYYTGETEPW